ncbi:MAG: hypothetical protein M1816_006147 [Peltula sp. TS41687]|nr:MAG: hypothetical protein M1816_006147 [Peltula sp. TS41687]
MDGYLSPFEALISSHSPVFENLVLHLPTSALLHLYHTSRFLRAFLESYPNAWTHLSFRLPYRQEPPAALHQALQRRESKAYALDRLLYGVVIPLAPQLRSLDLDDTAISGYALTNAVLSSHKGTLQHVSVRGCKNVSLKYHILPFLQLHCNLSPLEASEPSSETHRLGGMALKSLYVHRCRHHRRRPYTVSTLRRKESDAEATHELISLCHRAEIWTDISWCTTPGHRCWRRKEYGMRHGAQSAKEIWVTFDRLWRCGNRLGPTGRDEGFVNGRREGRLWEEEEFAYEGEQLGSGTGIDKGEGKKVPTHLRRSHTIFVENVNCYQCGEPIPERCEQCSVYMHCLGCRKTLCASCAFDRPSPVYLSTAAAAERTPKPELWWAPRAKISPNHVNEGVDVEGAGSSYRDVKSSFNWCCVCPVLSVGSSIMLTGHTTLNRCKGRLRTAPLPKGRGYEEHYFKTHDQVADTDVQSMIHKFLGWNPFDPSQTRYSQTQSSEFKWNTCPRNLCRECYASDSWKINCKTCGNPICKDQCARNTNIHVCGYPKKKPTLSGPMQSQIDSSGRESLRLLLGHEAELAARVPLPECNDDDLFQEALETSDSDGSSSNAFHEIIETAPLPPPSSVHKGYLIIPVWIGCEAFACEVSNPPCDCAKCKENPLCPNCYFKYKATECEKAAQDQEMPQSMKEFLERPARHYLLPKMTRQMIQPDGGRVWVYPED